jgi:formylglycine-generating enzyme required for sulfatase activity
VALQVLDRLDTGAVEKLRTVLAQHPSPEINRWFVTRNGQALQEVIFAERGGYELVRIPGGAFVMGSPETEEGHCDDERPLRNLGVTDFYMGRYVVTNGQYAQFLRENPKVAEPEYWADRRFNQPGQPVVGVSWEDAQRYAKWARLRLPSEAEWEYACRAGTHTRYYTGDTEDDLKQAGWYHANSVGQPHSVGQKEPNAFGLYDVHGNVWEWTEDDWHGNYEDAPDDGQPWIDDPRGSQRVFRGGGWFNFVLHCRSAFRGYDEPGFRDFDLGIRLSSSVALGP